MKSISPPGLLPTSASKEAREPEFQPRNARFELKYLVPDETCAALKEDLRHFLVPDEHAAAGNGYTVRSLYFDTPSIQFYYDKLHGHNCRVKVRLRRYESRRGASSDWFFEIKSKYHNACVKPGRVAFSDAILREHLAHFGAIRLTELVERISPGKAVSHQPVLWSLPLEPKVLVIYDREALVDPHGSRLRVTLDSNLLATFTSNPYQEAGERDRIPGQVLMEVKFRRHIPFWLEALIRKHRLRSEATSKYAQGVESAFPLVGVPRSLAFSDEGVAPAAVAYLRQFLAFR